MAWWYNAFWNFYLMTLHHTSPYFSYVCLLSCLCGLVLLPPSWDLRDCRISPQCKPAVPNAVRMMFHQRLGLHRFGRWPLANRRVPQLVDRSMDCRSRYWCFAKIGNVAIIRQICYCSLNLDSADARDIGNIAQGCSTLRQHYNVKSMYWQLEISIINTFLCSFGIQLIMV